VRLCEFAGSYYISVNSTLNPKIWDGDKLDPRVGDKLKRIAEVFEKFVGVDLDIVDITVTGSNANYNWTKFSDLDLHLVVKGEVGPEYRELFSAKKALWAEHHNITIKGLPVECYIQGASEPHHSTGVYSVLRNRWIIEPKKSKPEVNDSAIDAKVAAVTHDISAAITTGDAKRLQAVKDKITNMRKAGLERAGEWSTENLAFKALRLAGVIDELSEKIRELEDRDLSLENSKN
jgi:hypothetical protein